MGETLNRQDSRRPACGASVAKEVRGGMGIEEYVDRIAQELHERVEHQRAVMRNALRESGSREGIRYCPLVDCSRIETLRSAIRETVAVLEETRSAFKSKRLEVTRKRLIEILAES
jgi:hypothetical protein